MNQSTFKFLQQKFCYLIKSLTNKREEQRQEEKKAPFEIGIRNFPEHYSESLSKMLLNIADSPPKAFKKYRSLVESIRRNVCEDPDSYLLPEIGKERVMGWDINGEKVFDITQSIDTACFGGTFSASRLARDIKDKKGVAMAWLHLATGSRKTGMFIWPVELVIYATNQTFAGL